MSDLEEEIYSTMFTSLKHSIRRKILRMLSKRSRNFSEMLKDLGISSSHLTYHLENLGELVSKTDDGKYRLSKFGEAAVGTMSEVEEVRNKERFWSLPIKWKSFFVLLTIGLVVLAGVSYNQNWSLNRLSTEYEQLSAENQRVNESNLLLESKYNETLEGLDYLGQLYNETMNDFNYLLQQASTGTIYIRADGSILGTDRIQRRGTEVYTFTDNIYDEIVVERDNIVVDGAGYTLQGTEKLSWPLPPTTGIELSYRSNVIITDIVIKGFGYGIRLNMSSSNIISGNDIRNNDCGICLSSSSNNIISGNNITNSYGGFCLSSSSNNAIYGNNIRANNRFGVSLERSSNNTFKNNDISNNEYNFGVYGESLSHYIQDIDDSNTVDGKPVYYWVNRRDMAVPLDAGYVALVNCTNITVQNLNLTNNGQGVLLAFTTNSTITKNNITNNGHGIWLYNSSNNTISGNNIANSVYNGVEIRESSSNIISGNTITENGNGVHLHYSSSNTISGNNITNSDWFGIELPESSNNTVTGNNIANNKYGIFTYKSYSNKFYHNNFIINTRQVVDFCECDGPHPEHPISINSWDDGYPSGGNYWSDYKGVDANGDGIGDTPYVIDENNMDRFPLMAPISVFDDGT